MKILIIKNNTSLPNTIFSPDQERFKLFNSRKISNWENGDAARSMFQKKNLFKRKGFVPKTGFEPARRFQRYHLKVVRLPISPPGQLVKNLEGKNNSFVCKIYTDLPVPFPLERVRVMFFYAFNIILNVVPLPGSECLTVRCPL